jgi:hypothetical protein
MSLSPIKKNVECSENTWLCVTLPAVSAANFTLGTPSLNVTRQKLLTKAARWMSAHFAENASYPTNRKIHFTDKTISFYPSGANGI